MSIEGCSDCRFISGASAQIGNRHTAEANKGLLWLPKFTNPRDAENLGIRKNSVIKIVSRRAQIRATAFVTPTIRPGQLFIPMHYREVNRLTFPAFDPSSRQPSYKACTVQVEMI